MQTVTRRFAFDAAHRVMKHESKCANLHGHRYVAEITCSADNLDGLNRVIDFGMVKEIMGTWIDEKLDHNTILNSADKALNDLLINDPIHRKIPYLMNGEPTAESLAEHIFSVADKLISKQNQSVKVIHVRIYETPNCWADYPCS